MPSTAIVQSILVFFLKISTKLFWKNSSFQNFILYLVLSTIYSSKDLYLSSKILMIHKHPPELFSGQQSLVEVMWKNIMVVPLRGMIARFCYLTLIY